MTQEPSMHPSSEAWGHWVAGAYPVTEGGAHLEQVTSQRHTLRFTPRDNLQTAMNLIKLFLDCEKKPLHERGEH